MVWVTSVAKSHREARGCERVARKDRSASRIAANTRHDRAIQTACLQIKNPREPRPVGQHAKALAPRSARMAATPGKRAE